MRWSLLCLLLCPPRALADLAPLLDRADSRSWAERWQAAQEMARLPAEAPALRRALLEEPRPRVRAAVAYACFLDPALGDATLLGLSLGRDPDPEVRRCAAKALLHHPDRRAVDALVRALEREKDARTRLFLIDTLRALTPAPCLLDAQGWRDWWGKNAADPRFAPADEAAREGVYEGVPLETRTVAAVPEGRRPTRPPPHLLLLPDFGWTTEEYGPYLLPLRRFADLTWVRLPSVQVLTGSSGYGDDIPVYPVDRLVQALERFRAERRIERFVLLAKGASGWIAMRYLQLHPRRCDAILLIDTALDAAAYGEALARAVARGDPGERWAAQTLRHENGVPLVESTLDRLQAMAAERGFFDRSELEIGALFFRARERQGFATVPPIAFEGRVRLEAPALFLYSAGSAFSGHVDAERIQRHFPRALVAPLSEARGMPFLETNEEFHRVLEAFLRRAGLLD